MSRALVGLLSLALGGTRPTFDFWRSTRSIGPEPGPIHEFPYFTFLYGDLHAHMVSMPIQVAAVAVGLQVVRLHRNEILAVGLVLDPIRRLKGLRRLIGRPRCWSWRRCWWGRSARPTPGSSRRTWRWPAC